MLQTFRPATFCCNPIPMESLRGAEAPWLPEFTGALAGREVILIPDNDRPGRERAARIARALLGRATRLVILELDGAKDVSEWFEKGHGELELIALVEKGLATTA